jgi:DNA-directed RNA polymerase subunit RPC12/RpoP
MDCWHCQTELIWGGDHDCDDDEEYQIVSNLSCPHCQSFVLVYYPRSYASWWASSRTKPDKPSDA